MLSGTKSVCQFLHMFFFSSILLLPNSSGSVFKRKKVRDFLRLVTENAFTLKRMLLFSEHVLLSFSALGIFFLFCF